jgi:hypothetical protein
MESSLLFADVVVATVDIVFIFHLLDYGKPGFIAVKDDFVNEIARGLVYAWDVVWMMIQHTLEKTWRAPTMACSILRHGVYS